MDSIISFTMFQIHIAFFITGMLINPVLLWKGKFDLLASSFILTSYSFISIGYGWDRWLRQFFGFYTITFNG